MFPFAGEIREVELTKREWVLNGDSVQYTPSCMIRDTLEYDFDRHDVGVNVGVNGVVNDAVKLSEIETSAIKQILLDAHITAARLSQKLGVKPRQVQRIIASLKKKAGLKRRGADKNGSWYFESPKRSR